jgi:hypothetical protein
VAKLSKCHVCGAFPLSKEDQEKARINKLAVDAAESRRLLDNEFDKVPLVNKEIKIALKRMQKAETLYAKAMEKKEKLNET